MNSNNNLCDHLDICDKRQYPRDPRSPSSQPPPMIQGSGTNLKQETMNPEHLLAVNHGNVGPLSPQVQSWALVLSLAIYFILLF